MFAYTKLMQAMAAAGVVSATDPYFNLTTLLLPGNGTNGAQNNTFLDSSSNNFTITRNGNTTQGTFSPFSQTGWGNYFGGDGNYITAPYNAAFDYGTGDFSVECFAYIIDAGRSVDSSKYGTLVSGGTALNNTNLWNFYFLIASGVISSVGFDNGGSNVLTASSQSISLNAWHHFVLCRTGTTLSMFVDGTRIATATYSTAINTNSSGNVQIARSAYGSVYQNWASGYFSNARIVKGTQPYNAASSTITQPTSALTAITNTSLLTCQSNRFIDNSTNAFAITVNGTPSVQAFSPFAPTAAYSAATNGGSGYFDGTGDYLRAPSTTTSVFGLDTSNFTYETWIYIASAPSSGSITFIDMREPSGGIKGFTAGYTSTGNIQTLVGAPTAWNVNQSFAVSVGQWVHYALTRSSNVFRIFINGELKHTSATITGSLGTESRSAYIGSNISGAEIFNGYISGSRLVIGGALYTATFSVPTSPPTTTVSAGTTQLLLNYTNAGITDATAKNDLETVGNAQISTTQSKFGGSSMYFDGTTNTYLVQNPATSDLYAFGSGDFTIECWLYLISITSIRTLYDSRASGTTSSATPTIYIDAGTIKYYVSGLDRITGSALSTGQWYHIALARSGTSTKMFINGTQAGSTYTDSTVYINSSRRPFIGGDSNSAGSNLLGGYIDDLRITKGYARYTANFTPPTAAFPVQ